MRVYNKAINRYFDADEVEDLTKNYSPAKYFVELENKNGQIRNRHKAGMPVRIPADFTFGGLPIGWDDKQNWSRE